MSAIQSDVQSDDVVAAPADPAAEKAAPQKTARELAMEQLEARHQAEMAAQNGWELPADPDPEPAPAPDQLSAQLNDPEPEPAPVPAPTAAAPQKVKVKIDGEEAEVPVEDLVRQYQKNSTADKRLAEATRLLREAQEAEAARLLREQQAQQQQLQLQQQQQEPQPNPVDVDTVGARKEFLKALFEGDEDNALAKLDEMLAGRQQVQAPAPILDVDQIAQSVTQHVQQKLAVESVLTQNRRDYPELYADPDMEALALAKIQRMQAEEGTDFFAALDTVSKQMATKFGWGAAAPDPGRREDPAPTTSSRAQKLEQKRTIDNVASINTKTAPTEPQPEDASSIIAAMKAARAGG
jgi:hypothetical protein